jgi:hypothetical protein
MYAALEVNFIGGAGNLRFIDFFKEAFLAGIMHTWCPDYRRSPQIYFGQIILHTSLCSYKITTIVLHIRRIYVSASEMNKLSLRQFSEAISPFSIVHSTVSYAP